VPNKIWFGKNVKYDHLRVFGCKAFVHVLKDERSKLDAKSRQCIFIGYSENEFGYRFYDFVEKKLVRSRDVKFMKDQIIEGIDKVEKSTPKEDNGVADFEPAQQPIQNLNIDVQNDVGVQQPKDEVDVPVDDEEEEHDMSQDENLGDATEPPQVQLRRSNKERQPSRKYSSNEYVILIDDGEPEYFREAMESEEKRK